MRICIPRNSTASKMHNFFILLLLVLSVLVTFLDNSLNIFFYMVLIGMYLYYKALKDHFKYYKYQILVLIYALITIGTTIVHQIMGEGFSFQMVWRPIRIILSFSVGFYYAKYSDENSRKKLYSTLLILILLSVAYGFYQYYTGTGWGYNSRMDSYFGHPIVYGGITIIGFWLTFYAVNNDRWILKLALSAFILAGMISSGSRSTWIAFVLSVIIFLLKSRRHKMNRKAFYILIFILCLFIGFMFTPYFANIYSLIEARFSGSLAGVSASQRLGSYPYIFNQIGNSNLFDVVFGHGEGAAQAVMGNTTISIASFYTTDSQYLTLLYDYGLIAIFILFAYLIQIARDYFDSDNKANSELCILAVAIISAGFIASVFYDLFGWLSISTVICILSGICFYLHHFSVVNMRREHNDTSI